MTSHFTLELQFFFFVDRSYLHAAEFVQNCFLNVFKESSLRRKERTSVREWNVHTITTRTSFMAAFSTQFERQGEIKKIYIITWCSSCNFWFSSSGCRIKLKESVFHMLINLHNCSFVPTPVAVVGGTK